MGAHMPMQSERLAPGRAAGEDWARIDPSVFVAEGRRLQARAMVEALATGWRGFRWGVDGLAAVVAASAGTARQSGSRGTGRSSCSPGWTIGCSPTSACAAPTSSSRSTAGWPIRGCGARRRWRSYCSRAGAGRCRAPRPTAISRPRHDPFPTWPPDSRRTGWILSVRRLHWLSGGAGRSASRPGRRRPRRPRCCRA